MRVLITGASGLIGGRLAQHLGAAGHKVVLGSRDTGKATLPASFPVVVTDFDDDKTLDAACHGVDAVVHAAGMNAKDCQDDSASALRVNGTGTGRMASAARRAAVKTFVYLSTAHVYSAALTGSISESSATTNPHPYATSHLAGEQAAFQMSDDGGMRVLALRLSNSFGAPVHPSVNCWMLVANDLCRQWVRTGTLSLTSSGLQVRDFTTLTAVCETIGRLLEGQSQSIVLNIGGQSMSVMNMARRVQGRVETVNGSRPALEHAEARPGEDNPGLLYRTDRLQTLVGHVPQDFDAEIDRLLAFCRQHFRL